MNSRISTNTATKPCFCPRDDDRPVLPGLYAHTECSAAGARQREPRSNAEADSRRLESATSATTNPAAAAPTASEMP
jgi:hypothetical protein